jgi:putative transcriptional regulator
VTESLRGKLLIASPSMSDAFRRAVVLVIEHGEEGAFGLVLNQPSESTVAEAISDLARTIDGELVIHVGGPVQPNAVTAIGEHIDPAASSRLVVGDVGMVDLDDPPELGRVRVFAGYAGWGPGQLDAELEAEAWIVGDPSADDVFAEGDLWAEVLNRMGGEYTLLAMMPLDPSLN